MIPHFIEDFSDIEIELALASEHLTADREIELLNERHARQVEKLSEPIGHEFTWNGERYSSR